MFLRWPMFLRCLLFSCLCLVLSGCHAEDPGKVPAGTLMILGDSLSASYGMPAEEGWVVLLEHRLEAGEYPYEIHNPSVSGITTGAALARVDSLLQEVRPVLTIVELGANDGLRRRSLQQMRSNLLAIVQRLQAAGSKVLLLPMRLPPHYGSAYRKRFWAVYQDVAKTTGVPLGTFMLKGFAGDRSAFQADGLHPTAAVQARILDNIWSDLEVFLQ